MTNLPIVVLSTAGTVMIMFELAHLVSHYASILGLGGWVIQVLDEPAEEEHLADIAPVYGQKYAQMRIGAGWKDWDKNLLHSTIVHELLHLHMEHAGQVAEDTAWAANEVAGPIVRAALDLALEYAVDAIAVAVTPHLPTPSVISCPDAIPADDSTQFHTDPDHDDDTEPSQTPDARRAGPNHRDEAEPGSGSEDR